MDRVKINHCPPELVDGIKVFFREELLFFASAAFGDVYGGIKATFGEFFVEDELHITGAFKLLKDQLVHATAGVHQCSGKNGE